jgi:hypothetical protein
MRAGKRSQICLRLPTHGPNGGVADSPLEEVKSYHTG